MGVQDEARPGLEHRAQILHFGTQGQPPNPVCECWEHGAPAPRWPGSAPGSRGGFRAESGAQALPRGAPRRSRSRGRGSSTAGTLVGALGGAAVAGGDEPGAQRRGARGAAVRGLGAGPAAGPGAGAPALLPGRAGRCRGQEALREPRCLCPGRAVPGPVLRDAGAGTAGPGTRCGGGPGRGFPAFPRGLRGAAAPGQRPGARSGRGTRDWGRRFPLTGRSSCPWHRDRGE